MRILICHPDTEVAADLTGRIIAAVPTARIHRVATLTEAYNVTEHRVPDHLMIAAPLADAPEAELLFALAKLVGVHCIRLAPVQGHGSAGQVTPMTTIAERAPEHALFALLMRAPSPDQAAPREARTAPTGRAFDDRALILIGASTGGIDALIRVLRHWMPTTPPTLIVQHTGAGHMASLVRLLSGVTSAQVATARDGEPLLRGHVYLAAGGGAHLCLQKGRSLRAALVAAPPVSGHCPSVDMLFQSAVPHAPHVSAALLTGMGKDGAEGLVQLRAAGASTFAQDEATSVVFGMPRIAKERGGVERMLPIDKIGPALLEACRKRTKAA